jgi:hypothetical protein
MLEPHLRRLATLATATALALTTACASSDTSSSARLEVAGTSGEAMTLAVSSEIARQLLEDALGSELRCAADLDPDTERMLRTLASRSGRYTATEDGTTLVARRRGRSLRLQIRSEGARLEARMPWAVAECLLGRRTDLESVLAESPIRVHLRTANGTSLKLALDL